MILNIFISNNTHVQDCCWNLVFTIMWCKSFRKYNIILWSTFSLLFKGDWFSVRTIVVFISCYNKMNFFYYMWFMVHSSYVSFEVYHFHEIFGTLNWCFIFVSPICSYSNEIFATTSVDHEIWVPGPSGWSLMV